MLCRAFTGAATNTKKTQEISTGIPGARRGAAFIREAPSFFLCLPTVEITDLAVHQFLGRHHHNHVEWVFS